MILVLYTHAWKMTYGCVKAQCIFVRPPGDRVSQCGVLSDMRRVVATWRGRLLTTSIIAPPPMASEKCYRLFAPRLPDLYYCISIEGGFQRLVLRKCLIDTAILRPCKKRLQTVSLIHLEIDVNSTHRFLSWSLKIRNCPIGRTRMQFHCQWMTHDCSNLQRWVMKIEINHLN